LCWAPVDCITPTSTATPWTSRCGHPQAPNGAHNNRQKTQQRYIRNSTSCNLHRRRMICSCLEQEKHAQRGRGEKKRESRCCVYKKAPGPRPRPRGESCACVGPNARHHAKHPSSAVPWHHQAPRKSRRHCDRQHTRSTQHIYSMGRPISATRCTSSSEQGLPRVHFSAQLEPCLTHKNSLHTLNTPSTRATQPLRAPPIP
jgi:hypothetical protein